MARTSLQSEGSFGVAQVLVGATRETQRAGQLTLPAGLEHWPPGQKKVLLLERTPISSDTGLSS